MTHKNGFLDDNKLFTKAIKEELEAQLSDDDRTFSYHSDHFEEED